MATRPFALGIFLALTATSAQAQGPLPLVPAPAEAPAPADDHSGAPPDLLGGAPADLPIAPSYPTADAAADVSSAPAAEAVPAAIEMGALEQLDAWSVGTLPIGQGGLPRTLWTTSDAAALGALFDRLPAVIESPAARTLVHRALASAAEPPRGDAVAIADAGRKRFSALARMGFADDVSVMAAGATAALVDPNVAQFAAQSELARGRVAEACQRVRLATGDAPPPFILRLRAYCAQASGETAAADLALEVARSANAEDAWFRSAIGVLRTRPARPPAARYDNSLNASLSLAANLTPGPNPLAQSSTLALLTVARSQTARPALRAQAAALAFRRGALPAAEAREALRAGVPAPPAQPTGLIATVRDVEAAPGSVQAATAIAGTLRRSSAYGDFAAVSRLFHDDIAQLTQAPDPPSTLTLARGAAASGDLELAAKLADAAQQAGADAAAVTRLHAALSVDEATALARAAGTQADATLAASLEAAAGAHAIGDTAILASLIAAPGAHTLSGDTLGLVLRSLKAVGLDDAARDLTIEALNGPAPAP